MKHLILVTLLTLSATTLNAGSPQEAFCELARVAHNASPTTELKSQVEHWFNSAQEASYNYVLHTFMFASTVLLSLFESRDALAEAELKEGNSMAETIFAHNRVKTLTGDLNRLMGMLTEINMGLISHREQPTQGLVEVNAWLEQFRERQRQFSKTYYGCITQQIPSPTTVSTPNTSLNTSPEPESLPAPAKVWNGQPANTLVRPTPTIPRRKKT